MKNKALLVGINAYPNPSNQLRGCVNDIVDMENFIASKNKIYQRENIRTLTDSRATKKGILAALDWLILGATAGDQILFQYSGHGAQVPSQTPDFEKDGLDEIICPYDFEDENGAAGTGANAISDKEFAQLFAKIPKGCILYGYRIVATRRICPEGWKKRERKIQVHYIEVLTKLPKIKRWTTT